MTRVKICGICSPDDGAAAARAGATAIGMVFSASSPRAVDTDTARAIVKALPDGVPAIGVFVNEGVAAINDIIGRVGLFGVQLHGDEPVEVIAAIRRPVIRAMTVHDEDGIGRLPAGVTLLLDADDREKRGGTGRTIDWTRAARVAASRPTVLAGGLTPANVEDAVRTVRPYGVDVSSGVEARPRVKDAEAMRAFVEAVRRADGEQTA